MQALYKLRIIIISRDFMDHIWTEQNISYHLYIWSQVQ